MSRRDAILERAVEVASEEGLEGLTIGRLSAELGLSKSGLFGHFGSKEELQLATVAAAEEVFDYEVILHAQQEEPGLPRLEAYCEQFFSHLHRGIFPGGCFFTSVMSEFSTRPGSVRDRVATYVAGWMGRLRTEVVYAQEHGELDPDADPDQIVFEIQSALVLANTFWVLSEDPAVFDRGRTAISGTIERARR